ncbi:MAG: hypothetical protein NTV87_16570 [Ignavibacteriae bacterium]|nr:hypothetical protein [Ignavibacteriota bacterium]
MFTKFFKRGTPESMMRLLTFIVILTALILCGIVIYLVLFKPDNTFIGSLVTLISVLVGVGFGGKAIQSFSENSQNIN